MDAADEYNVTGVSSDALYHNVAQVFLSEDSNSAWSSSFVDADLSKPTLQFELDAPGYRSDSSVSATQYLPVGFAQGSDMPAT